MRVVATYPAWVLFIGLLLVAPFVLLAIGLALVVAVGLYTLGMGLRAIDIARERWLGRE